MSCIGQTARYARSRRRTLWRHRLVAIAAAAVAVAAAWAVTGPPVPIAVGTGTVPPTLAVMIVAAVGVATAVMATRGDLARLGAGITAEVHTARAARRWARRNDATCINGVALAHGGDVDHVIVGPRTVAAVETKYGTGPLTFSRGTATGANGRPLPRNPVTQVTRAATALRAEVGVAVTPIVCVAPARFAAYQHDGVWVCSPSSLPDVLDRTGRTMRQGTADRVIGLLDLAD